MLSLVVLGAPALGAPPPPPVVSGASPTQRAWEWMTASEEYDRLVEQTYVMARGQVLSDAAFLPPGTAWVVVLDLDETSVDNSAFQQKMIERHIDYDPIAWAAWEATGAAKAIPPAIGFAAAIRGAGGHVAWVSNRVNAEATKTMLVREGLWADDDRLCLRGDVSDKATRRTALRKGDALCGWPGTPMRIVAYLGDQRGDFPADGEELVTGASPWGRSWFMLPNPMYGGWVPKAKPAPAPAPAPQKGKNRQK